VVEVLSPPLVEHLVLMATRAPSVHNTQPWHVVVGGGALEVRADRTRQLPVIDPSGRQLLLSCGALVHHLVVACRAAGLDAHVDLLPGEAEPDLVARVRVTVHDGEPARADVAAAEAILHRSTHRRRFADGTVDPRSLDELRQVVEQQGAALGVVRDEDRVVLDALLERAERELLADEGYQRELRAWVFDPERQAERDDGIPVVALDDGLGRAEDLPGRRFLPGGSSEHLLVPPEHPAVVVLVTPGDARSDWVRCGMALSALLLGAEQLGLVAQPLGQVTDVAPERARLRHELGLVEVPQLVLRVGRAVEAVGLLTPRRPVDRVLTWAVDLTEPAASDAAAEARLA
jgi:nitroreductase